MSYLNEHMRIKNLSVIAGVIIFAACSHNTNAFILDHEKLARDYFQEDAQWYVENIPFFECSDKQIEQVYYYRWKMYKAHIRNTGPDQYVITEFINHVAWDRDPYCTINAASMHHIYEGRWLKDNRYMDGYINYLYQDGGNNRRYSESIADAAYARYLVNADSSFIMKQLDSMKQMFSEWSDHFDTAKQLYYIPAMPDATEYTIASIDASGGTDGFEDGEAYRPTINSYMYGNAMAIAHIAAMKGDDATTKEYLQKAMQLRSNVNHHLWNDSLQHFTDRFKVSNQYVHHWDFIRGRELAGLIPWYFNLPFDSSSFSNAWKHVSDTSFLLGKFGLRTNEPSYQYYFKQFLLYLGQPGSQWNGPSWPYQTSQALTAMANVLNDYHQNIITNADYIKILRLFAQQHYLPNGKLDLVENYDPNRGGPIVYYYWSNHYNHSSFNNLVISGLCGIRPSTSDTLVINPLADSSIQYFCLDDVLYHGHHLTLVYDRDGNHYKKGKGLTVFIDNNKAPLIQKENKYAVVIGAPIVYHSSPQSTNYALNIAHTGYPAPSASVNSTPDSSMFQSIDGRIWYFPEITNRWTTIGSSTKSDWFAVDFGQSRELSIVKIYPVADHQLYDVPDSLALEYQSNNAWLPIQVRQQKPARLTGNTVNTFEFDKVRTVKMRITFQHGGKQVAISEIEWY